MPLGLRAQSVVDRTSRSPSFPRTSVLRSGRPDLCARRVELRVSAGRVALAYVASLLCRSEQVIDGLVGSLSVSSIQLRPRHLEEPVSVHRPSHRGLTDS